MKRGLANCPPEVRQRVAAKGGNAIHKKRGLAAADAATRQRVATMGGNERAKDIEGLSEAGRKGAEIVKEKYGHDFFHEIGVKGGSAVHARYGSEHFSQIGKIGGATVKAAHTDDSYYSEIGRKGGRARSR